MPKNKRNNVVAAPDSESKVKVGVSLTPTGAKRLSALAEKLGLSRSELLERIARGDLLKSTENTELTFTLKKGSEGQPAAGSAEVVVEAVAESDAEEHSEQVDALQQLMTVKKELIQELEQISETELVKVLEFVRSLKSTATQANTNPVWQAYLESKRDREEVYRRLANS